jgi:DNA helicase II / ATP-dependent DNA helicase PcrA
MDNYEQQLIVEKSYLDKIVRVIKNQIDKEETKRDIKKDELLAARQDMYENTTHSSNDFDKLADAIQFLRPLEVQTNDYEATTARIQKYNKMLKAPYFARIDFTEEGDGDGIESIYIGLGNLSDNKTHQIYICDWRAPISSVFYRYGIGKASYLAPYGTITVDIKLKRQYEIKNSEMQYFFESSFTIMDDMLKQALSHNSSTKMKNIVETIQMEQDIIIRDIENDLLIVQGVAGSGKTSVALHRVAFLMYHGVTAGLNTNNIVLITPNNLFGKYIDNVLPELGEKNIQTITLEDMFDTYFEENIISRNSLIEEIISTSDIEKRNLLKSCIEFKMSKAFITILDRFLKHYEHRMIEFSDIFYNGECIVDRYLLKQELIKFNDIAMPLEKRLVIIESRIMSKIHEMRKIRLAKLEKFMGNYPAHRFEIKQYSRLLSLKQSASLKREIDKFTKIDAVKMYKTLIKDKSLFYRIAKGLTLPENIEQILDYTHENLQGQLINYEDGMVLLCLKLKLSGCDLYKDIKQVVVDEAQDYYPLQYEILKRTYSNTKYTIMGDINQSIEKDADLSIYNDIKLILNKKRCSTVFMKKSFRCSYEINNFSTHFANESIEIESFDRHEDVPKVIGAADQAQLEAGIIKEVKDCERAGYESIAIVCKSMSASEKLYKNIGNLMGASLLNTNSVNTVTGVVILPVYMAKGLEFDSVIIYQTNDDNYKNNDDKKLLYIACTRALHKLSLFYTGEVSRLVPKSNIEII